MAIRNRNPGGRLILRGRNAVRCSRHQAITAAGSTRSFVPLDTAHQRFLILEVTSVPQSFFPRRERPRGRQTFCLLIKIVHHPIHNLLCSPRIAVAVPLYPVSGRASTTSLSARHNPCVPHGVGRRGDLSPTRCGAHIHSGLEDEWSISREGASRLGGSSFVHRLSNTLRIYRTALRASDIPSGVTIAARSNERSTKPVLLLAESARTHVLLPM
jgi:hypothetical protein